VVSFLQQTLQWLNKNTIDQKVFVGYKTGSYTKPERMSP